MAISISAIAKDWGCARSYTQKCVKRGCPTKSYEAARLWREANTDRTRISPRRLETMAKAGVSEKSPMGDAGKIPDNDESLEDTLQGIKMAVHESRDELRRSLIEGKPQKIGAWISLHTRAVEARVKLESMVREELERQKVLIPMDEAQTQARKVVGVIVARLMSLPQNVAPRCNLTNPDLVMTILEDECAAILKAAQQAL